MIHHPNKVGRFEKHVSRMLTKDDKNAKLRNFRMICLRKNVAFIIFPSELGSTQKEK